MKQLFIFLVDIDECLSWPCLHGALCEDDANAYICLCPQGMNGTQCHTGTGKLDIALILLLIS